MSVYMQLSDETEKSTTEPEANDYTVLEDDGEVDIEIGKWNGIRSAESSNDLAVINNNAIYFVYV